MVMNQNNGNQDFVALRKMAEALLKSNKSKYSNQPFADILKLTHELEVHQIELELQNEELIIAKAEAIEFGKRFEDLYDFAPIAYLELSTEAKINRLNFAAAKLLGKSRSELIDRSFRNYVHVDFQYQFDKLIKDVIKNQNKISCELQLKSKNEDNIYVIINAVMVDNNINLNISDISELKLKDNDLLESERRMSTAIESLPIPVMIHDEEGKILTLSDGWTKYSGYTIEDIPSLSDWTKLAYGSDDGFEKEYFDKLFEIDETVFNGEWEIKSKNGLKRLWQFHATPLGRVSKGRRVLSSVAIDLTDIMDNEKLLIDARNMAQESDRLKSAFLANMSHEIRTPMNGILGFSRLLKDLNPKESDKFKNYTTIIEKSGNRLLNLINELIDISKIEAGLMETHNSEFNVMEQLTDIYQFFHEEAAQKGLKLILNNVLHQDELMIKTDKDKFLAILINLVKNSIKYTDTGSIEIGFSNKGLYVEFYVKDTGVGIPLNRQKAIFDRFVQADIEDKRAFQGAGLGLSISKGYLDLMGGEIRVVSDTYDNMNVIGSEFCFTLPHLKLKDEESLEIVVKEIFISKEQKCPKILLVEDDDVNSLHMSKTLSKFGSEIKTVKTGELAVETILKNHDYDLVFMDINLPGMDGYEASRKIKEINNKIIVIAQTAYDLKGDKELALNAGCDDYISKPINPDILILLIKKYFVCQ